MLTTDASVKKSAKVKFFVQTVVDGIKLYNREYASSTRTRKEVISWNSVSSIASGTWINSHFKPLPDLGSY